MPIASASVHFVNSNGVLHRIPDTAGAVREIHHILRPGGHCLVMLYDRSSFNYNFNIMVLHRLGASLLPSPAARAWHGRPVNPSRRSPAPLPTQGGHCPTRTHAGFVEARRLDDGV